MYWLREVAGWALILIALYLIRTGLLFLLDLEDPRIIEASVILFAAMGVLRGGTALIRIATAARLCRSDVT